MVEQGLPKVDICKMFNVSRSNFI
ncbi:hypothetical protein AAHB65_28225 [Bacillus toyonensis]